MKIAVLGSGGVGRTIAGRLAELGHDVVVGTRDPQETLARTEPDQMGNPPYAVWQESHRDVRLVPFADAAAHGDLVVNATSGHASLDALHAAGAPNLAGKVLIDVANPLDASKGFPPNLFVKDTDSLAEQIQRAFPDARVVKTLNTVTASVMVDPKQLAGGDHTVFVAGNDEAARQAVADLLHGFGWTDVFDLGDLTGARAVEMLLPLWLRLFMTTGSPVVNVKVVR
jgi:8-hydroxy-5-deazaflavin:NADPH oxidoreductase